MIFDSPHRFRKMLGLIADAMPNRRMVVARELSKMHEELIRGTAQEVVGLEREWVGEITLVFGPWSNH